MFSAKKKLYFVFTEEQDEFFTDSMLRLNTVNYLWLMLRKSGYENVFHIRAVQDAYDVEIMDSDAARVNVPRSRTFLGSKPAGPSVVRMENTKLLKWLRRSRKKEKSGKTALIFQAGAIQRLFQSYPEDLAAFAEVLDSGQVTAVVQLPMCLTEKERMIFTSAQSIFARKNSRGVCLSEPVYDMIHSDQEMVISEKLKAELGDSVIQLGAFSYGRICAMLRWLALRLEVDMTAEQYRDYANFLYWYVYSPNLRAFTKEPLEKYSNARSLVECLLRHGAFETIDERVAVLKKQFPGMSLPDILYRICPLKKDEDRSWLQITHDNQTLLQLSRLPFPVDFVQTGQDATVYDRQRWLEMQRWITKPHTASMAPEVLAAVTEFQEIYQKSLRDGDGRTALRAARVLYETAANLYLPAGPKDRMRAYRIYLQMSQSAYRLEKQLCPDGGYEQLQQMVRTNATIGAAVTILMNYHDMLGKMTDAFLLPDGQFGHLLREASELMKQAAPGGEKTLSEEEKERLCWQFENVL